MVKVELKRFSKPGILMRIQAQVLNKLLETFKEDLAAKNVFVTAAAAGCDGFYSGLAEMFKAPEKLPDNLVEALLAMEEQITPANWARFEGTMYDARAYANFSVDTSCWPESLALQLWLWCPYKLGGNLAEIQPRIASGKKIKEEKDRIEREYQAREDALREKENRLLTPAPSVDEERETKSSKSWIKVGAILPSVKIDSERALEKYFMKHQVNWIQAEDAIHAQNKSVYALAEKSVRIGWTHADAFKNVRKRLRYKNRDYLFATKDYPSALEYMRQALKFAEFFDLTKSIVAHGEDDMKVQRLDENSQRTGFTDEIKMGYIKFDNGSCIRAFSSHPQAMSVYGGDVGLDEFAKHPNAQLLWETAQARVTWGFDIAVWSAHDGEGTLFYQFAQEARAGRGPWNLYYRVTMVDALELGLLKVINRVRGTLIDPRQFLADCKSRARLEEIFEQSYMCNPAPSAAGIVEWSAIERCRVDYKIERVHLEAEEIRKQFGEFRPEQQFARAQRIRQFIRARFGGLFKDNKGSNNRLGFDVAASGAGDLMVIYIDEVKGAELWLRALFTCRTEDWDFIKTVLFAFMEELRYMQAAGDETGLGKQICWEAAKAFSGRFTGVNFSSRKQDIGFALMNQLSVAEKRFPRSEQDIAADYFALRKTFHGSKWIFSEGTNSANPASHCDIAWAGGLATEANNCQGQGVGAEVCW